MLNKFKNSFVILAAFIAGSLVSIATTAVLAHGGDTSKIHGCVRTNGALRVVGANDNCNNNETALDWNIQGPTGPQGPAGPMASGSGSFTCWRCGLTPLADKFKGKDFSDAYIPGSSFHNVDLTGVIFKNAFLGGVNFDASNLSDADLSNVHFSGISGSFGNNVITGAIFGSVNLQNTNFENDNLTNVDFSGALNMNTANLTGVTWNNTVCPDGTNSDDNGNTCVGHLTP